MKNNYFNFQAISSCEDMLKKKNRIYTCESNLKLEVCDCSWWNLIFATNLKIYSKIGIKVFTLG